jgi:hypothetical protein
LYGIVKYSTFQPWSVVSHIMSGFGRALECLTLIRFPSEMAEQLPISVFKANSIEALGGLNKASAK